MKRYSHLYSIGLSVISRHADEASASELLTALEKRLQELYNLTESEVLEAFNNEEDTFNIED